MAGPVRLLLLLPALAAGLPRQQPASNTLWRRDKLRDTRVDDVIKDIKQLVEEEYLQLLGEGSGLGEGPGQEGILSHGQLYNREGQVTLPDNSLTPAESEDNDIISQFPSTSAAPVTLDQAGEAEEARKEVERVEEAEEVKEEVKKVEEAEVAKEEEEEMDNEEEEESSEEVEAEERGEELCDTAPDLGLLRNGLGQTGFLWPGGRIPYIVPGGFDENQTATIQAAIKYYNDEFAGCLQWVERTDENNYVTFDNSGSCSSRIGVAFFPFPVSQSIQLGRCAHLAGHVKHEMMHTIGFYHEHSRSDRDMYIEVRGRKTIYSKISQPESLSFALRLHGLAVYVLCQA
jgi:hypothetical protein